jgi:hypothetical protein
MLDITGKDFLLALSQAGLAVGGFGSLIISLRQGPSTNWNPREVAALFFILEHAFGMTLLALLPFILAYAIEKESDLWRLCNVAMATSLGVAFGIQVARIARLKRGQHTLSYPKAFICGYLVPTIVLTLIQLGYAWRGSAFLYSIGLLFLVLQAVVQFWISLFVYTRHGA